MPLVWIYGSNFVLNLPLHLPAKKGMRCGSMRGFLRSWCMVCSLLLVVRVTICCAGGGGGGGGSGFYTKCPCTLCFGNHVMT